METMTERRSDTELRLVIDKAIEYQKTHGQNSAMSFLIENYVPTTLLQRVLMRDPDGTVRVDT